MNMCHCSVCHHTFGGLDGFDRHRQDGQCRSPMSIGLHWNDERGVWSKRYGEHIVTGASVSAETLHEPPETVTIRSVYADPASFTTVYTPPRDPRSRDW